MDYLAPLFNETAYCLSIERLLGIEAPTRAQVIRVLLMEINRIGSHLVALATGGMELGALTGMTNGFREREEVLHLLEFITGLRMNHAFIRPGGVAQDLPEGAEKRIHEFCDVMDSRAPRVHQLLTGKPIWQQRLAGSATCPSTAASRSASPARSCAPRAWPGTCARSTRTCGYEQYDFEVPTDTAGDSFAATSSGSRRCTSRCGSSSSASRPRAGPGHGRGRQDRVAGQARRSARTAWATRSTTSARSWASRWSP